MWHFERYPALSHIKTACVNFSLVKPGPLFPPMTRCSFCNVYRDFVVSKCCRLKYYKWFCLVFFIFLLVPHIPVEVRTPDMFKFVKHSQSQSEKRDWRLLNLIELRLRKLHCMLLMPNDRTQQQLWADLKQDHTELGSNLNHVITDTVASDQKVFYKLEVSLCKFAFQMFQTKHWASVLLF